MAQKTLNAVSLSGYIKTRLTPQPGGDKCYITASLSTTPRRKKVDGKYENDGAPQWHTIIPVTRAAADSLRNFRGNYATLKGIFRRRSYIDKHEKTRHAVEVLVFDPVESCEPGMSNLIEVHGNLGRDPHIAYAKTNGVPPEVELAIATTSARRNPDKTANNKWLQETTWHKVIMTGEEAVLLVSGLKKGYFVKISGQLAYRDAKRGQDKVAEVKAFELNGQTWDPQSLPLEQQELSSDQTEPVSAGPTPEEKFRATAEKVFGDVEMIQQGLPLPPTGNRMVEIIPLPKPT